MRVYYRAVARSVGVPDFWLEDATQDMTFALWRDEMPEDVTAIRREAIDCARRYGRYSRYGARPELVSLAEALDRPALDEHLELVRIDIRRAARALTNLQRQALKRRMAGLPMSSLDSAHASAARRKLWAALAA